MSKKDIYIVQNKSEKKPYTIYFGEKIPKYDYNIATFPFFNDKLLWIYCDDEGRLKELEPNMYAFDVLIEMGEYLKEKDKELHEKWCLRELMAWIPVGPVHLEFTNKKLFEDVKQHILKHCELAEIVED